MHSLTLFFFTYVQQQYQCALSVPPESIRKPYGFLMFSGGREKVHWEQMS